MWGALIGAAGSAAGSVLGQPNYTVSPYSTMTPEQTQSYNALLSSLGSYNPNFIGQSSYTPTAYGGGYTPTQFDTSQYNVAYNPTAYGGSQYQSMMNPALTSALAGTPSTTVNTQTTEDFYRNAIERPAVQQYEEQTRPAWMQKTSNIHSSARDIQEQQGYEDLYSGLQSQRANLMYQDEQARRGLAESAAQRQMSALGIGQQMTAQDQSVWNQQNQNALSQSQLGLQQGQLGLGAAELYQTGGLQSNAQNLQAWQAMQQNQLSADQNQLAYGQAALNQSALPYQLGIQALGINGIENIAYPQGSDGVGGMLNNPWLNPLSLGTNALGRYGGNIGSTVSGWF
jgi:hypothetical protein